MFVDMKSNRQLQSGVIWSCQSCFGLIRSFTPQKLLIFFFSSCSSLLLSYLNILCVSEKCYVLLPKGFYFCKDMSYFFLSNLLSSELSKKSSQVTLFIFGYVEPVVLLSR